MPVVSVIGSEVRQVRARQVRALLLDEEWPEYWDLACPDEGEDEGSDDDAPPWW